MSAERPGPTAAECPSGANIITGTEADDVIVGTEGVDCIFGLGGDDQIDGLGGDDVVVAGDGNDVVDGGDGNDEIFGGPGDDTLRGGLGDDQLLGQGGADSIDGGDGADLLEGGGGDDALSGGDGNDQVIGGDGTDVADGGNDDDHITGDEGDDTLRGGNGDDTIDGGAGNDTIDGGNGTDVLSGGAGDDIIDGGNGGDLVDGGAGTDTINTGRGSDTARDNGDGDDIVSPKGKLFLTPTMSVCVDDDGGFDPRFKGTRIADFDGVPSTETDRCSSKDYLWEYDCEQEQPYRVSCAAMSKVCDEGACTVTNNCADDDEGINIYEKADIFWRDDDGYHAYFRTDSCSGDVLTEWYCDWHGDGSPLPTTRDCAALGMACIEGACVPAECTETDDGDDPSTFGTKTFIDGSRLVTEADQCVSATVVMERVCDQDLPTYYDCEASSEHCDGGECVPMDDCYDSDFGLTTDEVGEATSGTGPDRQIAADYCLDTARLAEGYCRYDGLGGAPEHHTIHCSALAQMCLDGRCVDPICEDTDEFEDDPYDAYGTVTEMLPDGSVLVRDDACLGGSNVLLERRCIPGFPASTEQFNCEGHGKACIDGACVECDWPAPFMDTENGGCKGCEYPTPVPDPVRGGCDACRAETPHWNETDEECESCDVAVTPVFRESNNTCLACPSEATWIGDRCECPPETAPWGGPEDNRCTGGGDDGTGGAGGGGGDDGGGGSTGGSGSPWETCPPGETCSGWIAAVSAWNCSRSTSVCIQEAKLNGSGLGAAQTTGQDPSDGCICINGGHRTVLFFFQAPVGMSQVEAELVLAINPGNITGSPKMTLSPNPMVSGSGTGEVTWGGLHGTVDGGVFTWEPRIWTSFPKTIVIR